MANMGRKNLPDKVDELLTEVVNKDPLVLASISTVPYFGGSLATFFSAKWLKTYQERTDALFQKLGKHLNNLDEQTIKQDYFDTAQGIDLLIKATEQSTRTRSEEKRDLIARILCGAAMNHEVSKYSPEEYLNLISDLTVRELIVARSLYETRPDVNLEGEWNRWEEKVNTDCGIDKPDLYMTLSRLSSTGLLQRVLAVVDGGGATRVNVYDEDKSDYYIVTQMFDKLMKFLQLTPQ